MKKASIIFLLEEVIIIFSSSSITLKTFSNDALHNNTSCVSAIVVCLAGIRNTYSFTSGSYYNCHQKFDLFLFFTHVFIIISFSILTFLLYIVLFTYFGKNLKINVNCEDFYLRWSIGFNAYTKYNETQHENPTTDFTS